MKYLRAGIVAFFAFAAVNAVRAADMAVKAPPTPPAPVYSWTGFYVGGNVGYGWQDPTVNFTGNDPTTACIFAGTCFFPAGTAAGPASYNLKGGTGGIQAGYNLQVDPRWILGLETDFNGSGIHGSGNNVSIFAPAANMQTITANQSIKWFGTVRARLGWLATDGLMLYGTGGFAYARVDESVTYADSLAGSGIGLGQFGFLCGPSNSTCMSGASTRTALGWTAGAGAEYAVTHNVSLKAEYLYVSLGGNAFDVVALSACPTCGAPPGAFINSSFTASYGRVDFQIARFGLNYKFN